MRRRDFLTTCGAFCAASAIGPGLRALAGLADEVRRPLGDYWTNYLNTVAEKVRERARKTADGFWFITDPHTPSNRHQSGKALAALTPLTPLRKTVCGGDVPGAFATGFKTDREGVDYAVSLYRLLLRDPVEASGQLFYAVKGNHDFTIRHDPQASTGFTYSTLEARRMVMDSKGCQGANIVTNEADPTACYYYFDNAAARIRYIFADTTDHNDASRTFWAVANGMGPTQLLWLADKALSTIPDGWSAVVIHHIPLTGCVGDEGDRRCFTPFRELLEAYQNRGRTTLCGKTYDFAQARGRILMSLSGHEHAERQTFQNGVLHVTEPCDAAYEDYIVGSAPWCGDLPKKRAGTVYEQTFDAVQLDPEHGLVYFTRVGGGQDRVIHTRTLSVKKGRTLRLEAPLLKGPLTWGCYDAERIVFKKNPNNRYCPLVAYTNVHADISADGTLTARDPGEVMVVAMDPAFNKEIIPVRVEA